MAKGTVSHAGVLWVGGELVLQNNSKHSDVALGLQSMLSLSCSSCYHRREILTDHQDFSLTSVDKSLTWPPSPLKAGASTSAGGPQASPTGASPLAGGPSHLVQLLNLHHQRL